MDGRISRNKSKQVDEKTVKRNGRNVDGWTGKRISKQQVVEGKAKNGRWEGQVKKWQTGLRKDRQKNSRQVYGRTGKINSRFVDGRTVCGRTVKAVRNRSGRPCDSEWEAPDARRRDAHDIEL